MYCRVSTDTNLTNTAISCSQPADGETVCPNNPESCFFTADPDGGTQGSCATYQTYYNGTNTNIRNVTISGTNYDLTDDALGILLKTDLLPDTSLIDQAITCLDGYQYGKCDGPAGSDDATNNTCNTYDNNERLCRSSDQQCTFSLGDQPRVSYDECIAGNGANSSILVGKCINTCTADVSLADPVDPLVDQSGQPNLSTYFFVGGGSAAATAATAAVESLYDPGFSDKDSHSDDWPGTMTEPATVGTHATPAGTVKMNCGSSDSSGHRLKYDYTCNGGGSYFSVSDLSGCNQTCTQLYSNGSGHSCGDDIYTYLGANADGGDSVYTSYDSFVDDCCTPKTCSNSSGGISVYCRPYEKPVTTQPDPSATIDSNTCCDSKTCADFISDYNTERGALTTDQQATQDQATTDNVCPDGNFMPDNLINNRYLGITSTNGVLGINIADSPLDRVIDDLNATDIGCCEHLTCDQWATREIAKDNSATGMSSVDWGNDYCSDPAKPSFSISGTADPSHDTATNPTTNACCVTGDAIQCSPTDEMNATADANGIRIPGYLFTGTGGSADRDAHFTEILFTLGAGGIYYPTNDGDTPQSNSSCAPNYVGTPILQCQRNNAGNRYSITGCVPNAAESDSLIAAQSHCASGSDLASHSGEMKICQVPAADTHPGAIFSNFILGVSGNGLVNMDTFAHQLNLITCENSSNKPCIHSCDAAGPTDGYQQFSISGCEYQNKLPGDDLHSDLYWKEGVAAE